VKAEDIKAGKTYQMKPSNGYPPYKATVVSIGGDRVQFIHDQYPESRPLLSLRAFAQQAVQEVP
jgi:hypothetical protein